MNTITDKLADALRNALIRWEERGNLSATEQTEIVLASAALYEYDRLEAVYAPPVRVGIRIEGGQIQSVFSDAQVEVLTIDYETEYADQEAVIDFPHDGGDTSQAAVSIHGSSLMPEEVARCFAAAEAGLEANERKSWGVSDDE